jgi:hypothetical protein
MGKILDSNPYRNRPIEYYQGLPAPYAGSTGIDALCKLQCAYDIISGSIFIGRMPSMDQFFDMASVILDTFGVNSLQSPQDTKTVPSPNEAIARLLASNDKQGITEIDVLRNAGYTITVSEGIASDGRPGTVIAITNPKK